jgi:hypothetical protein
MISIVSAMDIVERLRVPIWTLEYDTERKEAANEIERLRAALAALVADVEDYERVNNLAPNPGKRDCWQSVTQAKAVLGGR